MEVKLLRRDQLLRSLLVLWLFAFSGPACRAGTNPSNADIRAMLVAAGQAHHIPPHILFAIAFAESGWRQFNADGSTHLNPDDGGIGIMQITGSTATPYNHDRLMNEIVYNINAGAEVLEGKWNAHATIGDSSSTTLSGREKLENWYYAVWAYNSWGYINNPNHKNAAKPYTAHDPTYQDIVYGYIAACPSGVAGMWVGCSLTRPSNADIGSYTNSYGVVGSGLPIPNTPSPYHVDANFDGVIDGDGGGGSDTDIYVDKGNSAQGQDGSAKNPYNTVKAALNRASATQPVTIHITLGTYSEKIGTGRHIHFVTNGNGTVRIGG